jgi:hypothetical protein
MRHDEQHHASHFHLSTVKKCRLTVISSQLPVQPVSARPGFVAAVNLRSAGNLFLDPPKTPLPAHLLRGLWQQSLLLPTHRDQPRMHVEPKFYCRFFLGFRQDLSLILVLIFIEADRMAPRVPSLGYMSSFPKFPIIPLISPSIPRR